MIQLTDYQHIELNRAVEMAASPTTHMRPRIFIDGNKWCALYGDNLQDGVAGFGNTPEHAAADFDHNWRCQKAPQAIAGDGEGGVAQPSPRKSPPYGECTCGYGAIGHLEGCPGILHDEAEFQREMDAISANPRPDAGDERTP